MKLEIKVQHLLLLLAIFLNSCSKPKEYLIVSDITSLNEQSIQKVDSIFKSYKWQKETKKEINGNRSITWYNERTNDEGNFRIAELTLIAESQDNYWQYSTVSDDYYEHFMNDLKKKDFKTLYKTADSEAQKRVYVRDKSDVVIIEIVEKNTSKYSGSRYVFVVTNMKRFKASLQ